MAKRENYNDLYLFMQVVREGSFTAAAQRLGLAQSGISRSVRELEERLGVQLLARTTRRLSLTHAGEQLYRTIESGFDALDMGLATLAHYRQSRQVRYGLMPVSTLLINCSCQSLRCLSNAILTSGWNSSAKVGLSILLRKDSMPVYVSDRKLAVA